MDVVALSENLARPDVVDVSTAGGTELLLPVRPRLLGAAAFHVKIVR